MHALVDAARSWLSAPPSSAASKDLIEKLSHNRKAELLRADEALRRNGVGLNLSAREIAPDGRGMTADDIKLYEFTIGFLDREARGQAAQMRVSEAIEAEADQLLAANAVVPPEGGSERRDLELGLLNARLQAFGSIKQRLAGEQVSTPPAMEVRDELRLGAAFDRWASGNGHGLGTPRPQTVAEAKRAVSRFVELHGDLELTAITKAHGRAFRDAMARVPKHLSKKHATMTLPQLLTANLAKYANRSPQSVNKVLSLLGGVLTRAERDGYFDEVAGWSNPFHVGFVIAAKDREPFEPFSPAEIKALLSSPVFSQGARPVGGMGEAAYWLPLISLYSGARRTVIAQLQVGDVRSTASGIPFFDFNDDNNGKTLKTISSARSVPIHPELIRLGFMKFVEHRRLDAGAESALLASFSSPVLPKAKAWTKWFGRYLFEHVTTSRSKTFHYFRHTFKRACREAAISEEVHHAFTGHSGGGVGRKYGRERREDGTLDRGISIERLAAEIAKVSYPTAL